MGKCNSTMHRSDARSRNSKLQACNSRFSPSCPTLPLTFFSTIKVLHTPSPDVLRCGLTGTFPISTHPSLGPINFTYLVGFCEGTLHPQARLIVCYSTTTLLQPVSSV